MSRFYASRASIAEFGRWVRQGVVFYPPSWAAPGILEPTVRHEGTNVWKMWFRSGGLHSEGTNAIGYATSTDGIHWTDLGGPILGNGVGGESNLLQCPHMRKFGSTYYLYYSDVIDNKIQVAATANGTSGFTITDAGLSLPTGATSFGHANVFKVGSTYHMYLDAYLVADDYWGTWYATSSSPTSGFSYANSGNQITTLRIAVDGTYGAFYVLPESPTINGLYQGWYHASPVTGNVNSNLYRGYSTDLINWTQVGHILDYTGNDYEIDQVADPCVLEVAGTSYLYYDADTQATGACVVKLATIAAPLSNVVSGT